MSQMSKSVGLEALVRELGLGWRLDLDHPADQKVACLQRRLDEGDQAALAKFTDSSVRMTLETITALVNQSTDKARAFVEQLFGEGSAQMLVMVWRVLHGAEIGTVRLDIHQASRFCLEITLRPDRKGTEERYASENVYDLYVIRHFGIGKLKGQLPILLGFYPTRRPLE